MTTKTFWNGEQCMARRVIVKVGKASLPTWWFAGLEGTERRAVEVTYSGETFLVDDDKGKGWHKVTIERGGPRAGHSSLCGEVVRERNISDLDETDCHCSNLKNSGAA